MQPETLPPRSSSLPTATFPGSRRSTNVVTVVEDANMSPPLSPERDKDDVLDDITVDDEESDDVLPESPR